MFSKPNSYVDCLAPEKAAKIFRTEIDVTSGFQIKSGQIDNDVSITFSFPVSYLAFNCSVSQDFRHILNLCDKIKNPVELYLAGTGLPFLIKCSYPGILEAKFILATLVSDTVSVHETFFLSYSCRLSPHHNKALLVLSHKVYYVKINT